MISQDRWRRVQPILDGAIDLADEEVPAYLDRECAADPTLRRDVERLLAAAKQDLERPGFLDRPVDRAAALILTTPDAPADSPDPLAPGQIVGPYRVVRRIGSGGMGVVYLAHDARLDRNLALKLLPPWLAADETARRRFTDEARAASALDHPNIATVYDIGTGDAGMYITMAYYEGETLEARLRRGPRDVEEAWAIGTQLADGLRAAHAKGIVHRDIKPSNVIVTGEGVVKIVDFGVAKVAHRAPTTPGGTPGTVAYMSPEQTAGGDVDARSDIWAVGVVLYEMVASRRPFRGDVPDAVIAAIRHDAPAPIATLRPGVPQPFANAVMRCLEKHPDGRFSSADALLAALRGRRHPPARWSAPAYAGRVARWATAAAIVLFSGTGLYVGLDQVDPVQTSASEADTHRIAVLPLHDASDNSASTYLAAGMTGELITRLSKLRGLGVIGHTSVRSYGDPDRNLAAVVRTLDVRSIVEGRVSVEGDRVGIAVWLVDAASRQRLWEEQYDAALADVPGVQRDIAERVATALQITIDAAEHRRLRGAGAIQPEAYRAYLRGRYWLGQSESASYSKAHEAFQAALDVEPTYALAWAGLADGLDHLAGSGSIASREAYPRARAAAERALDLDPDLAEAHTSLAMALTSHYWDNELAERHFRQAIDLSPSYARAHRTYATHLRNLCRLEAALAESAAAEALDPLDFFSHYETTIALYFARRYDEAVAHAQRLVQLGFVDAHIIGALARTQQRAYTEALEALDEVDGHPHANAVRGYVYGLMGRHDDARRLLTAIDDTQPGAGFLRAIIHMGLRQTDDALRALERAYEERSWMLRLLNGEPMFDPLRADPRFQDLLTRTGFADARGCSPPDVATR